MGYITKYRLENKLFEVGKTYKTAIATGENFKLTTDPYVRDENGVIERVKQIIYGVYEKSPHLGNCPLLIQRLIPETEKVGYQVEICDCCKKPIDSV